MKKVTGFPLTKQTNTFFYPESLELAGFKVNAYYARGRFSIRSYILASSCCKTDQEVIKGLTSGTYASQSSGLDVNVLHPSTSCTEVKLTTGSLVTGSSDASPADAKPFLYSAVQVQKPVHTQEVLGGNSGFISSLCATQNDNPEEAVELARMSDLSSALSDVTSPVKDTSIVHMYRRGRFFVTYSETSPCKQKQSNKLQPHSQQEPVLYMSDTGVTSQSASCEHSAVSLLNSKTASLDTVHNMDAEIEAHEASSVCTDTGSAVSSTMQIDVREIRSTSKCDQSGWTQSMLTQQHCLLPGSNEVTELDAPAVERQNSWKSAGLGFGDVVESSQHVRSHNQPSNVDPAYPSYLSSKAHMQSYTFPNQSDITMLEQPELVPKAKVAQYQKGRFVIRELSPPSQASNGASSSGLKRPRCTDYGNEVTDAQSNLISSPTPQRRLSPHMSEIGASDTHASKMQESQVLQEYDVLCSSKQNNNCSLPSSETASGFVPNYQVEVPDGAPSCCLQTLSFQPVSENLNYCCVSQPYLSKKILSGRENPVVTGVPVLTTQSGTLTESLLSNLACNPNNASIMSHWEDTHSSSTRSSDTVEWENVLLSTCPVSAPNSAAESFDVDVARIALGEVYLPTILSTVSEDDAIVLPDTITIEPVFQEASACKEHAKDTNAQAEDAKADTKDTSQKTVIKRKGRFTIISTL